jgi:drug/metabolite transporter (DMT)-like permease
MRHRVDATGVAFIVFAAIGFGMLGPLARFAADEGFSPVSFAVWRSMASVATLVLLLAAGVAVGRLRTTRLSTITRLEWVQLAAMGGFVAGTTLSLFWAFERTTIALTLIVFYTFPVMVAIAAVPLYGEHLGIRKAAAIALAVVGLILLLLAPDPDGAGLGLDGLGVLFAFGAALCQVGYALVGARGFASVPAFQSATVLRLFSLLLYGIVLVPLLLLLGEGADLTQPLGSIAAWALIIAAGAIAAALPTALLVAGYRRVGPTRGAVLMLVEPVTGVILAALLLAEQPTTVQLAGGCLVLAGAALVQLAPVSRSTSEAQPTAE